MSALYEEHVEKKDLDSWDNVRTPRPEEPELYENQQVRGSRDLNTGL